MGSVAPDTPVLFVCALEVRTREAVPFPEATAETSKEVRLFGVALQSPSA